MLTHEYTARDRPTTDRFQIGSAGNKKNKTAQGQGYSANIHGNGCALGTIRIKKEKEEGLAVVATNQLS